MPVDPEIRAVLDLLPGTLSDLDALTPATMREQMEAAVPEPWIEMADVSDLTFPGPAGPIGARCYRPLGASDPAPVVVFFHGGGWVVGSLETHDDRCRELAAASGAVFVSVDYRLAPEHPFPAATDDAAAAVRWVAEHADDLGVDPARLAVAGDSAGGNLAAVTAQRLLAEGGPSIALQVLVYPCCDVDPDRWPSFTENAEGYLLTRDAMHWFYDHYLPPGVDRTDPRIAPIRAADLTGLPPAYVVTAEYDPLRDEGEAYADRLRAAGVDTVSVRYDGAVHGFFGFSAASRLAAEANAATAAHLASVLG